MKGYIKISVDDIEQEDCVREKVTVDAKISANDVDKIRLVRIFCDALSMNDAHLLTAIVMKDELRGEHDSYTIDRNALAAAGIDLDKLTEDTEI